MPTEPLSALSPFEAWLYHRLHHRDASWAAVEEEEIGEDLRLRLPLVEGGTLDFVIVGTGRAFGTEGPPSHIITAEEFRARASMMRSSALRDMRELDTDALPTRAKAARTGADCWRELANFHPDEDARQKDLQARETALRAREVELSLEHRRRVKRAAWAGVVLPCRSLVEAQAALIWLGWPPKRPQMVERAGQRVAEYVLDGPEGREVLCFAAPPEDRDGTLHGGTGEPSKLLPPGVFWALGQRFERLSDNTGMAQAAGFYEEIARFVPEGEDEVPPVYQTEVCEAVNRLRPGMMSRTGALVNAQLTRILAQKA